jgi:hypothetical protein
MQDHRVAIVLDLTFGCDDRLRGTPMPPTEVVPRRYSYSVWEVEKGGRRHGLTVAQVKRSPHGSVNGAISDGVRRSCRRAADSAREAWQAAEELL